MKSPNSAKIGSTRRVSLVLAALLGTALAVLGGPSPFSSRASAQQITVGTSSGAQRIKMAVTEFQGQSTDARLTTLTQEFNSVLWNDLDNAGIFDLVNRSFYPLKVPIAPGDVAFDQWANAPVSTQMLAFGKTEILNSNLVVTAYLYDVKNPSNPEAPSGCGLGRRLGPLPTARADPGDREGDQIHGPAVRGGPGDRLEAELLLGLEGELGDPPAGPADDVGVGPLLQERPSPRGRGRPCRRGRRRRRGPRTGAPPGGRAASRHRRCRQRRRI